VATSSGKLIDASTAFSEICVGRGNQEQIRNICPYTMLTCPPCGCTIRAQGSSSTSHHISFEPLTVPQRTHRYAPTLLSTSADRLHEVIESHIKAAPHVAQIR
jgi:hypothetical protein